MPTHLQSPQPTVIRNKARESGDGMETLLPARRQGSSQPAQEVADCRGRSKVGEVRERITFHVGREEQGH